MAKRSVMSVEEFVGWDKMTDLCEAGENTRDQALPAILFQTGGRVSEVLQLTPSHFSIDKDFVIVRDMPIVKQRKLSPYRSFTFPLSEPVWVYSSALLKIVAKNKPLFPIHRSTAYRIVVELGRRVGLEVWDHWFRAQRACQVHKEYGLSGVDLEEWFRVRDATWQRRYSRLGVEGLRNLIVKNISKETAKSTITP